MGRGAGWERGEAALKSEPVPRAASGDAGGLLSDAVGVAGCLKVKMLLQGGLGVGDNQGDRA